MENECFSKPGFVAGCCHSDARPRVVDKNLLTCVEKSPFCANMKDAPLTEPPNEAMRLNKAETPAEFIERFEAWCEKKGLSPTTVCNRVLGNTYALDALRNREDRSRDVMSRLIGHMADIDK